MTDRSDGGQDTGTEAETLLHQRYRQGPLPSADHWNQTAALLLAHRSIRAFSGREVPAEKIELAVAAAQSASTSQNIQPWSVVAVRDRARIEQLAQASLTQRFVAATPVYLVWLLDLSRLALSFEAIGADISTLARLDPLVAGAIDASLAAQNAAIYLESTGLGVVYIGALRYMPELVITTLDLPGHVLPLFGMCVGYPDEDTRHEIKPRLPLPIVLQQERYTSADPDMLRGYSDDLDAFRLEQDMRMVSWASYSARRFAALQQRVDREGLEERIKALGFGR